MVTHIVATNDTELAASLSTSTCVQVCAQYFAYTNIHPIITEQHSRHVTNSVQDNLETNCNGIKYYNKTPCGVVSPTAPHH